MSSATRSGRAAADRRCRSPGSIALRCAGWAAGGCRWSLNRVPGIEHRRDFPTWRPGQLQQEEGHQPQRGDDQRRGNCDDSYEALPILLVLAQQTIVSHSSSSRYLSCSPHPTGGPVSLLPTVLLVRERQAGKPRRRSGASGAGRRIEDLRGCVEWGRKLNLAIGQRSEKHTSELPSLMRIS